MNTKKYISIIVGLATVATVGSLALAMTASAATTTTSATGQHRGGMMGGQRPGVIGTVSAISGNTITVNGKQGFNSTTTTPYTVDATNATVTKNNAASTVSNIAVGDTISVQGTVSGTNVTATSIRDGAMMGGARGGRGIGGTVASVSGTTLTVTSKAGPNGGTATTYTVDASSATVTKSGATSSVSGIAVGDTVMVQGTVSGTSVTATSISDGQFGKGGMSGQTPSIQGNGQPIVAGKVATISGTTLTITNNSNVTYTIDASSAKVTQGQNTITTSNINTGDTIIAQGTVNGTSVVASSVIDQTRPAGTTTTTPGQQSNPGFFGSIGQFFMHLFGF